LDFEFSIIWNFVILLFWCFGILLFWYFLLLQFALVKTPLAVLEQRLKKEMRQIVSGVGAIRNQRSQSKLIFYGIRFYGIES